MTVFEKIKSMSIDEFAEWFDEHCAHDTDPCIDWWNDTYCKNCEPEIEEGFIVGGTVEYAWCELHGKCKYFKKLKEIPSNLDIIKMWLSLEVVE